MKALVLAGGNGTQPRSVSHSTPRHLLPVAGRPVLEQVVTTVVDAGVTEIGIVAGAGDSEIPAVIGDGDRFGARITLLRQPEPRGPAHAVALARDFLGEDDFVLYFGDNFLPEGIREVADEFRATRPAAQLVVGKVANPGEFGVAELDENGNVRCVEEKPRRPRSDLAVVGVYFFTSAVHDAVAAVRPRCRGERALTDAIGALVNSGARVHAAQYSGFWADTGRIDDLLDCNRAALDTIQRNERLGSVDDVSELTGPVVLGEGAEVIRSRIDGPALIDAGTVVEDSRIGPHTAIGRDCAVRASAITDSLVLDGATITGGPALRESLVGREATVGTRDRDSTHHRLVIGDHADVLVPAPRSPITEPYPVTDPLRPREDLDVTGRFARSAERRRAGHQLSTVDAPRWLAGRASTHDYRVDRIPFAALDGWAFDQDTGNLGHHTGRFFTVEGLDVVVTDDGRRWQQPIIVQPEVGILGILAKEFDGVLHFLMQAKMEPGNPNLLQLSPTVQATRSNFTKVHRGAGVRYLEYFTDPALGRPLVDVLQSEHGSWFLHKTNRNMIVEARGDVPPHEDFRWLTLGQIGELLHHDNLVNMDSRTVLACAPGAAPETGARHSDTDLLSWFTAEKARHEVTVDRIPLAGVRCWRRGDWAIEHRDGRYFRVMAVSVRASNREVRSWTQPMIEPIGVGVAAFVVRRFGGVAHLLAHARVEGGFLDVAELGPTVQYTPEHHAHLDAPDRPPFLDLVLAAPAERIRYQGTHSEEGGRFFSAETRYLFVEATADEAPTEAPTGYHWVTPGQLSSLLRHGRYVNVQARTLLSLLTTRAVRL